MVSKVQFIKNNIFNCLSLDKDRISKVAKLKAKLFVFLANKSKTNYQLTFPNYF